MSNLTRKDFLGLGALLAGAIGAREVSALSSRSSPPGGALLPPMPQRGAGIEADTIIVNARVLTQDTALPRAEAVAIKDGRFLAVGADADVRNLATSRTRVIDAARMTVVPGFIDCHCHPRGTTERFLSRVALRVALRVACGLAAVAAVAALASTSVHAQKVHKLPATPSTVAYGYYWSEAKPVLTIASGDIVEIETMLTNSPAGLERLGVAPADIPQALRDIVDQVTGDRRGPGGHILTGPIFVTGAVPGDVLEVRILSISLPLPYGYNGCSGFMPEFCISVSDSVARASGAAPTGARGGASRLIHLDRERLTAVVAPGITVPLRPFWGSIGVAPEPAIGRVSSNPPHRHAGNMDNKELVAGTTLFVPVFTPGALLQLGDGHAAQGDGEVDQTALETNLTGRIQVVVRKDLTLDWPRIETPTHWITMGADTSLVVATRIAVGQMVRFLVETKGITRTEAYQAASMAADLRITQLVDGNVGVHMMIAKAYLR